MDKTELAIAITLSTIGSIVVFFVLKFSLAFGLAMGLS